MRYSPSGEHMLEVSCILYRYISAWWLVQHVKCLPHRYRRQWVTSQTIIIMLQTMPVKKTESTTSWEKYEGPRTNQPTKVHIIQTCLTRDFSTLTREIHHWFSRPDPLETRTSRVTRSVAGRVGSGQHTLKISRVGSGRVGSGRVRTKATVGGVLPFSLVCLSHSHE